MIFPPFTRSRDPGDRNLDPSLLSPAFESRRERWTHESLVSLRCPSGKKPFRPLHISHRVLKDRKLWSGLNGVSGRSAPANLLLPWLEILRFTESSLPSYCRHPSGFPFLYLLPLNKCKAPADWVSLRSKRFTSKFIENAICSSNQKGLISNLMIFLNA